MEKTKRCPFCAEEILAAAIKCKHCRSDLPSTPHVASAPLVAPSDLLEDISSGLEKKLSELLQPTETVLLKLKGAFNEALVCTNLRVLILKAGFMTGHLFGANVFQLPYRSITSAQVNTHLLTGYLEVSAGGVQNTPANYWARGNDSPQKRENCVALVRALFPKFQRAAGFILSNCG